MKPARFRFLLILVLMVLMGGMQLPVRLNPAERANAVSFILYGRILAPPGWGFTSSTVHNPGPDISVLSGATVTLSLFSGDGMMHSFCVDYESTPDFVCQTPGEPLSPNFSSSTTPLSYTFTARTTPGNYTYFCNIHGMGMEGKFIITAPPPPPPTQGSSASNPARPS